MTSRHGDDLRSWWAMSRWVHNTMRSRTKKKTIKMIITSKKKYKAPPARTRTGRVLKFYMGDHFWHTISHIFLLVGEGVRRLVLWVVEFSNFDRRESEKIQSRGEMRDEKNARSLASKSFCDGIIVIYGQNRTRIWILIQNEHVNMILEVILCEEFEANKHEMRKYRSECDIGHDFFHAKLLLKSHHHTT